MLKYSEFKGRTLPTHVSETMFARFSGNRLKSVECAHNVTVPAFHGLGLPPP